VTIAGITGVTLNPTSVATPPANSTTAATSPATTTPSPPNSQPSKDYSGAIGAGVGVPLGFLAIGIIGYLLWRNRRNNARSYNQAPPYQTTDPYNEWMAMKNQPTPSLPIEQYKHQAETNVAGERRSSVHQLPTAEHFEPQELASGRSW
jgi:uncharacterized protein HemX